MPSRPVVLALVILILCALLIVPVMFGSVFFAYSSAGASLYTGISLLIGLVLVATLVAVRRFFHRP
jgi:hypothetical protein